MSKYLISKEEDLTVDRLGKILTQFQTRDVAKLNKYWNYYIGKQEILNKKPTDTGKPCNKVVINYCYSIVKNYLGYLTGIPIRYSNGNLQEVIDILNYNDVVDEDSEHLRQALIFGVSYELNYIDEDSKQRFRVLDPRECVPIYWNNLSNDLAYVVRFYREALVDEANESYIVEVYGADKTSYYKSSPGFSSFIKINEQSNFYNQVPVTVFELNKDQESIFDKIISLQDAYNQLYSGSIDSWDSFADAYLILKGAIADDDDLENMKKNRVLMLDPDSDVSYLTKSVADTDLQNILSLANDQIHTIAACPDMTDEKFLAQSGVAIQYKLVGFENAAAGIANAMKKALQKRIELICSILNLTGINTNEYVWRDVEIVFTRNLPISLNPTSAQEVMAYKGLVSDETLLALLPFVKDVDEEMQKVQEESERNMELYRMNDEQSDILEEKE